MSIKDLKIGKRFLIEPADRYDPFLMEVKVLDITTKAIKWERVDRKPEAVSPSWALIAGFSKNYSVIEELED